MHPRLPTPLALAIPAAAFLTAATAPQDRLPSLPPISASYAVLGRDKLTGEYGVAAASHAALIGLNLEFLDPDAGGVVVLGGPYLEINDNTLIALRDGLPPGRAIAVGLVGDPDPDARQALALSPNGAAAFTGKSLPKYAGHTAGDDYVVAGHHLASDDVIPAIEEAFVGSDGTLADRLLAALQAGRDAGGEEGGAHSAALLVVGPGARFATRHRLVDLRIDFVPGDAVAALAELRARIDSVYGRVRWQPPR